MGDILFNSWQFLLFFPAVVGIYFGLPQRFRTVFLLMASCFFYMAFVPHYILILLVTIVIDYYAGIKIETTVGKTRKWYLIASIVSTSLVLIIFKYANFFLGNMTALAHLLHWNYSLQLLHIMLPIGLSFHTFQSLSYVIEVYRGKQTAERNFLTYALYVMFFPQLVAGPIERPQNLLHQFREHHTFDPAGATRGLRRILWGFFKKIVIADNLALYVTRVFAAPHDFSGPTLFVASIFFSVQIYCDFSGYSDIAIGSARVMGFSLMENFRQPYLSRTVSEFWRRWHISLSTWFKDYVYIPLGGSRAGLARWCRNILLVFALSGLWHGANWTYVVWGIFLGASLVVERGLAGVVAWYSRFLHPFLVRVLQSGLTLALLVTSWMVFRAATLRDAWYIVIHSWYGVFELVRSVVTSQNGSFLTSLHALYAPLPGSHWYLALYAGLVVVFVILEILDAKKGVVVFVESLPLWARWSLYSMATLCIMNIGVAYTVPFIYFQF